MKICSKCGEEKELSEYSKHKTTKDKLNNICNTCKNDYQVAYRIKNNLNKGKKRTKLDKKGNGIDTIYLRNMEECFVDAIKYDLLCNMFWFKNNSGYVTSYSGGRQVFIHRIITDCPKDKFVDHIDGNPMNNRLENLRICDKQQNCRHRTILQSNNSSGYQGVVWHKIQCKWNARINITPKCRKSLGYFDSIEDAIEVRKQAEEKYFGEFKPTIKENN